MKNLKNNPDDWAEGDEYVSALGLSYHYDLKGASLDLNFEDGVSYSFAESLILSRSLPSREDLQSIHKVKKEFDGVLLDFKRKDS
jgi:hypothetical protein